MRLHAENLNWKGSLLFARENSVITSGGAPVPCPQGTGNTLSTAVAASCTRVTADSDIAIFPLPRILVPKGDLIIRDSEAGFSNVRAQRPRGKRHEIEAAATTGFLLLNVFFKWVLCCVFTTRKKRDGSSPPPSQLSTPLLFIRWGSLNPSSTMFHMRYTLTDKRGTFIRKGISHMKHRP